MNYESLLHAKRYMNIIDQHLQDLTNTPAILAYQVPYSQDSQEQQFLPETVQEFRLKPGDRLGGIAYKYDHISQNRLIAASFKTQSRLNQNFKLSLKNKSNAHNLDLIKQKRDLQELI